MQPASKKRIPVCDPSLAKEEAKTSFVTIAAVPELLIALYQLLWQTDCISLLTSCKTTLKSTSNVDLARGEEDSPVPNLFITAEDLCRIGRFPETPPPWCIPEISVRWLIPDNCPTDVYVIDLSEVLCMCCAMFELCVNMESDRTEMAHSLIVVMPRGARSISLKLECPPPKKIIIQSTDQGPYKEVYVMVDATRRGNVDSIQVPPVQARYGIVVVDLFSRALPFYGDGEPSVRKQLVIDVTGSRSIKSVTCDVGPGGGSVSLKLDPSCVPADTLFVRGDILLDGELPAEFQHVDFIVSRDILRNCLPFIDQQDKVTVSCMHNFELAVPPNVKVLILNSCSDVQLKVPQNCQLQCVILEDHWGNSVDNPFVVPLGLAVFGIIHLQSLSYFTVDRDSEVALGTISIDINSTHLVRCHPFLVWGVLDILEDSASMPTAPEPVWQDISAQTVIFRKMHRNAFTQYIIDLRGKTPK
jgi:hypothetical protein